MPFAADNFDSVTAGADINGRTASDGGTWTVVGASVVGTAAGRVRGATAAANESYYHSGTPGSADHYAQVDLVNLGTPGNAAGPAVRFNTSNGDHCWAWFNAVGGTNQWEIWKSSGGSLSQLAQAADSVPTGTTLLKLDATGTTLTASISTNGGSTWTQKVQVTDSSISAAGKAGIHCYGSAGTTSDFHLDNFSADVSATRVTVSVTNGNVFFSPYNWRLSGSTYAQTNNPGAYCKLGFSGTSVHLTVDVSPNSGESSGNYPAITWRVDSGAWQRQQLASSSADITLASGLASGTHALVLVLAAAWWQDDRWTTPAAVLRVTGFTIDSGASSSAPSLRSGRMVIFGDSNDEGYEITGATVDIAHQDASQAAGGLVGRAFDCEFGVVAFAGQGYTATGGGNVPTLPNAWDHYDSGNSRLVSSLLSPAPDYVVSPHGQNDSDASDAAVTAAVSGLIAAWRAAAPDAKILICSPPNLAKESAIRAGVTAANDANAHHLTTGEDLIGAGSGAGAYNNDNHLTARGHARYAAALIRAAQAAVGAAGAPTYLVLLTR